MKNITFEKISWGSLQPMTRSWIYTDWREWKRPRISVNVLIHLPSPLGADTEAAEDQKIKIPDYKIWELGSSWWRGRTNQWTMEKKHSISTYFAHTVGKILKQPANVWHPAVPLQWPGSCHSQVQGGVPREGRLPREGRWAGIWPLFFHFQWTGTLCG